MQHPCRDEEEEKSGGTREKPFNLAKNLQLIPGFAVQN